MIPVNSSNFNSSSSCSLVGVYEIYRQHMILDLIFHSVIHPGAHKACLQGRGGGGVSYGLITFLTFRPFRLRAEKRYIKKVLRSISK